MAPPPIPDRTETLAPRASSPAIQPPASAPASTDAVAAGDPDRYEQVSEHARGGLGRVMRAVDKRLGRTVAVKELLRHDAENEARFLREALITARLEHPGIVPVHEAGRWPNGDPYYVMKLVEGRTLKELITERLEFRGRCELLPHVIAVADAVGYAHSEGVIHRDLKPSNVIVGEFGETIVVDWGLARDRKSNLPEPESTLLPSASASISTISGKVVGTPAYMAPEQARGELVDERADVYAIGAMLYELLAGGPPHAGVTPQAVLDRVLAGPPMPLCAVGQVPDEIATIVDKAMARNPDDRYPNASALAEDLRRYQTGKLVTAHSYTTWALLRKKLSHHRGVVAVAVASALALGGLGVESFRHIVHERNNATTERARAEDALLKVEKRQRDLVLLQASTSLLKDPTAALAWLKQYDGDRVSTLDVLDEAIALGVARHVFRPADWVFDSQFTPDGKTLVSVVRGGEVRAYDLATGGVRVLGRATSAPEAMALSPDGQLAVTGSALGEVIAFPVRGGEQRVLATGGRAVGHLSFSPDAKLLLVERDMASSFETIAVADGERTPIGPSALRAAVAASDWSRAIVSLTPNSVAAVTPNGTRLLGTTEKAISFVALSPKGDIALVHDLQTVYRVPFAGGKLEPIATYPNKLTAIAWSPDERQIALIGQLPEIPIVDVATGKTRELRGHTDEIYNAEWTRDGKHLLTSGDDSTARVWNLADGSALVLRGHEDDVYRAHFSADERSVATSSLDGTVRVWSIDHPGARSFGEGSAIESLTVAGGRALVKTATAVASWDLASGAREARFAWGTDHNLGVGHVSPDGETLVIPHPDWSMEARHRGGTTVQLKGHCDVINYLVFSRDSKSVLTASNDGTLRRWDLATGTGTVLYQSSKPIRGFALAPDGRVAALVGDTAFMIQPDGASRLLGTGPDWCVIFAEFEPVHGNLVLHRCDHSLAIVDNRSIIDVPTGGYPAAKIAFSPDGTKIAGAMGDRTVRIWDAATGRALRVIRGHTDLVMDVAFSPDGTQLASASYDKTVRVWDLASGDHRVLRGHSGPVDHVVWRDASHLVTGSRDGTLRLWDTPTLQPPSGEQIATALDDATTARIDGDRPTTATK